ncbi:MAG: hypothetical protein DDT22_01120 [candidate division WS2 bacterium]|nr:hypothetical protein [Candidatus Lithacetigena glycinireducens]
MLIKFSGRIFPKATTTIKSGDRYFILLIISSSNFSISKTGKAQERANSFTEEGEILWPLPFGLSLWVITPTKECLVCKIHLR